MRGDRAEELERVAEQLSAEVISSPAGALLLKRARYPLDHPHGARALGDLLGRPRQGAALVALREAARALELQKTLFFDIESVGLDIGPNSLAFLVGLAGFDEEGVWFEQIFTPDPREERAALIHLAARLEGAEAVVSYNGKRFDVPYLSARFKTCQLEDPFESIPCHLDLFHATRRLLLHHLSSCRLATVERERLGVYRVDDLPGAEAPGRYARFLDERVAEPVVAVFEHNRDDVLSLITLLDLLLERIALEEALVISDPLGGLSLAESALKLGDLELAGRIYAAAEGFPETAREGRRGLKRVKRRARAR